MAQQPKVEAGFWERLGDTLGAFGEGVVNFLGRLFGYATIRIESANEESGLQDLSDLKDPIRFNRILVEMVSAKQGIGIHDVLEAIVHLIPPPKGSPDDPLRALIFDSWFDPYRGVIILCRVIDGRLRVGEMEVQRQMRWHHVSRASPAGQRVEPGTVRCGPAMAG